MSKHELNPENHLVWHFSDAQEHLLRRQQLRGRGVFELHPSDAVVVDDVDGDAADAVGRVSVAPT